MSGLEPRRLIAAHFRVCRFLLGNITYRSDVGTYSYEGDTGTSRANPHAATAAGSDTLAYDHSGNMTDSGTSADYSNSDERELFYEVLREVAGDYNWVCHADCQMTNHYHLCVETPDANLSAGMRQLNVVFTRRL